MQQLRFQKANGQSRRINYCVFPFSKLFFFLVARGGELRKHNTEHKTNNQLCSFLLNRHQQQQSRRNVETVLVAQARRVGAQESHCGELDSSCCALLTARWQSLTTHHKVAPMCQYSGDGAGNCTEWHHAHLASMALSGAGLLGALLFFVLCFGISCSLLFLWAFDLCFLCFLSKNIS